MNPLFRSLLALLLLLSGRGLLAASILQIDTTRLATEPELAFQGEVLATRSYEASNGRIYTLVDFQVEDLLFGDIEAGSVLTLRFTGGRVGSREFSAGVRLPQPGEHGLYFVEKRGAGLINPLLGWSQGHFTIQADGSLLAGNGEIVTAVGEEPQPAGLRLSKGVARGIETRPVGMTARARGAEVPRPMMLDAFKSRLRALRQRGTQ